MILLVLKILWPLGPTLLFLFCLIFFLGLPSLGIKMKFLWEIGLTVLLDGLRFVQIFICLFILLYNERCHLFFFFFFFFFFLLYSYSNLHTNVLRISLYG